MCFCVPLLEVVTVRWTDMAAQMTDSHRRFLQTLMANGIVSERQARTLHRFCCETHNAPYDPENLDNFVSAINAKLQPLSMQIRKGLSEEKGDQHYALVNMTENDVTKLSSDYAENELELFKKIMDLIVGSDCGTATSIDILNSTDTLTTKKLKKIEAEQLLNRLVQDQWLCEKQGVYSLSTRCILEMESYIRAMYQDQLKLCHICHNVAFQCQVCENPTCSIRIHNPCATRYFKDRKEPQCPACNDAWCHKIPDIRGRQSRNTR
ncbi:non-structural maintenance of chromosomes element 1 homolog isoform X2 [Synchiropus splendidus]|uniref:non-structural maintenance of chromosomes element 1 homolog isoform X2 n=1 Tax=Synchiropus splendidus TaxID=270530 RepID=UPI00237D89A1|nr:non-structural maintenance of chromosomes element 1 homolog isoform X2 [Synchiropus splendidus]